MCYCSVFGTSCQVIYNHELHTMSCEVSVGSNINQNDCLIQNTSVFEFSGYDNCPLESINLQANNGIKLYLSNYFHYNNSARNGK